MNLFKLTSCIILLATGLLVFSNSLYNEFVWDDIEVIVNNTPIHSISNIKLFFTGGFFNTGGAGLGGDYYRPLPTTIYSLIYTAFGPNPIYFRLPQILIHIINSYLVFILFSHLFKSGPERYRFSIPLFLSLVFLIHPINSEVAIYISNLQDSLYFLFGISSLLLVIKGNLSIKIQLAIFLLTILSLLSKETGILFIALSTIYIWLYAKKTWLKYTLAGLPAFGTFLLLRINAVGLYSTGYHIAPIYNLSLTERLISFPKIIEYYLGNFFIPNNLAVAEYWVINTPTLNSFFIPLTLELFFLLVLIIFKSKIPKNHPDSLHKLFIFFSSWLGLDLLLHLQIIPLDLTVATRWFYPGTVAMLGLIGIIIWTTIPQIAKNTKSVLLVSTSIIIILALLTYSRNQDWKDPYTLFSTDIKTNNSFSIENNLGNELFRRGKIQQAKEHFQKSVELAPNWWPNWNNLGAAYEREGDTARAKEYYQRSLLNSSYYIAYQNLGLLLLNKEKDASAAARLSEKALRELPDNPVIKQIYIDSHKPN